MFTPLFMRPFIKTPISTTMSNFSILLNVKSLKNEGRNSRFSDSSNLDSIIHRYAIICDLVKLMFFYRWNNFQRHKRFQGKIKRSQNRASCSSRKCSAAIFTRSNQPKALSHLQITIFNFN